MQNETLWPCRGFVFLRPKHVDTFGRYNQRLSPRNDVDGMSSADQSSDRVSSTSSWRAWAQNGGLIAGPVVAVLVFLALPDNYVSADGDHAVLTAAGKATLSVMTWMAIWWLTEAIDISATALLPIAVFPLLGVAQIRAAAAPYAHPLIFLFLGGFILALSMSRWGLDRRISLVTLRLVGTRPGPMVAGFMIATATLSAFVSNTATSAMMLPIALSVIRLVSDDPQQQIAARCQRNFATCLMLAIAYSASIGGMVTIVGTPPNVFLVSYLRNTISEAYRVEVSFARWLMLGIPLAIVFLPAIWLLLSKIMYPVAFRRIPGGDELIRQELRKMGRFNRGELATFVLFLTTAALWIFLPLLRRIQFEWDGATLAPLANLTDPSVVMITATILFVIPVPGEKRGFVMDWDTAVKLPWGILILFGGGLSLAAAVDANGVAEFLGSYSSYIRGVPKLLIILVVTAAIVFLTELTSNLATTATVIPILAALAPGLNIHPYDLIVPATLAASCAFMLPVATPPNAIVFASGKITMGQMARTGFWLNLLGILIVTMLSSVLVDFVFEK